MKGRQQVGFATFDCFDTVFTRALGGPRSVSYLLAHRLRRAGVLDVETEVLVCAHVAAEAAAYRRHGVRRTLAHVAAELAALLDLGPEAVPVLLAAEERAEQDLARPVPARLAELARLREQGTRVGFLSDTGMSSAALGVLLQRVGATAPGDPVWVSNELAAEKARGQAFGVLAARSSLPLAGWSHRGDDPRADVQMARWSGVAARWVPDARLTRFEQRLDEAAAATTGFSCALAGASRRTRLVVAGGVGGDPHDDELTLTCGVVLPLAVGFGLWVLRCSAGRRVAAAGPGAELVTTVLRALAPLVAPDVVVLDPGEVPADGPADGPVPQETVLVVLDPASSPGLQPVLALAGTHRVPVRSFLSDAAADPVLGGAAGAAGRAAAALLGARAQDPELAVLAAVYLDELVPVAAELDPRRDVRLAVVAVLRELWDAPGAAAAGRWLPVLDAADVAWPQGRWALAPHGVRALARAGGPARRASAKARRLLLVLGHRRRMARGVVGGAT